MINGNVRQGAAPRRARRVEPATRRRRPVTRRGTAPLLAVACVVALGSLQSCAAPQAMLIKSGLDSLRTEVAVMKMRDSLAHVGLAAMRTELGEQRDILLSTRAATGSTTREMYDQMERLEARLSEVLGRFQRVTERAPAAVAPGATSGVDPAQIYDQAAQDLTQGRYEMALAGFRDVVLKFPSSELADNAQYGAGECFFALAHFDSASAAYAKVESLSPDGDKVPAALFKLALSREKEGKDAESKQTLEDLVRRFPNSGEAQLARERLGTSRRR
jgi:tol-pal system protein YbgF